MRKCTECGKELEDKHFAKNGKYRQSKCRLCYKSVYGSRVYVVGMGRGAIELSKMYGNRFVEHIEGGFGTYQRRVT